MMHLLITLSLVASIGDTARIIILHTNTIHGAVAPQPATWINPDFPPPVGGADAAIVAISAVSDEAQKEGAYVLLLDAGEAVGGGPVGLCFTVQPVLDYMNRAGYDAMEPGVRELMMGPDSLVRMREKADFPFLCSNLRRADDTLQNPPYVVPYKIFDFDSVRVGVFGLVSEASFIFMPFWTRDNYFFSREVETARKMAHFLRDEKKVDIVVALTHIGLARDTLLIDSVPDIDVIVGGFDGRGMREPYESPYTHGIVVRTYERLTSIGRLDLFFDKKDRTIVGYKWKSISLSLEEVGEE